MTGQSAHPLDYSNGTQSPADAGSPTISDRLKDAGDTVRDMTETVVTQAGQLGERAQQAAGEIKPFVEKSLKDQPIATLASAAVIGFVLGALWKK
jgi:ElaB/YqjD/DUF883 family membrane-anchored ribosome-binding protein